MAKMVSIRLEEEDIKRLNNLVDMSGWTKTQVVKRLLADAYIKPSVIGITPEVIAKRKQDKEKEPAQ